MKLFLCLGLAGFIAVLAWMMCIRGAVPTKQPDLAKKWDGQVYGLDEGEVVRVVATPFTLVRIRKYTTMFPTFPNGPGQMVYGVSPAGLRNWAASTRSGTVESAVQWCSRRFQSDITGRGSDTHIPYEIGSLALAGDFILREDAPIQTRMKALESIALQTTGRDLAIEPESFVEKQVIVVSGKWELHPLAGRPEWSGTSVHLYTDALDLKKSSSLRQSFQGLLDWLKMTTRLEVIDETSGELPKTIRWYVDASAIRIDREPTQLDVLLANVQKQTSLTFRRDTRPMPIWTARRRTASSKFGETK